MKLKNSKSMEKNICNVIWVDDDIENICPETGMKGLKRELKEYNIEVIGKARTYLEFKQLMDICKDRVDAVITDANFNDVSPAVTDDKDFKGLIKMIGVIESYNERRYIPFYLYSGKEEYFKFENGELDYFKVNNRKFKKGEYEKMFKKIRLDIEHINSREFQLRNKYKTELEAAGLIDANEKRLMNALLYDYSDEWENTEDYFNPLRKMVETIFAECSKNSIIPLFPSDKLNDICKFLSKQIIDGYCICEGSEIMPKPLTRALKFFLEITQDGSHDKPNLNLKVDDYVRNTKNVNLFRTVLFITMDLCLWYKRVKEESDLPNYTPKWEKKDISDFNKIKSEYESKTWIPIKDEKLGVWFCGECVVTLDTWENGKCLKLKDFNVNTAHRTKKKYPYYAHYDVINENN